MSNENDQDITESTTAAEPPTPKTPDHYLGLLLKDRYLIERELGRGGIGVVYLARDKHLLSREVVIKVLFAARGNGEYDWWFTKKFRQEMEALARINHPGVVGVLDSGEAPDGKAFLVMQYVRGVTLRRMIPKQGMDFEKAARIIRQTGQALEAAHDRGVLHRDLKPENIMIEEIGGGERLRIVYFSTVQRYYDLYVELLMRMNEQRQGEGFDGMALQAVERARARSLLDLLAEARADIRSGVD